MTSAMRAQEPVILEFNHADQPDNETGESHKSHGCKTYDLNHFPSPNRHRNASTVSEPTVRGLLTNGREKTTDELRERRLTAYERLSHDLLRDNRCLKEITLGKRIGFYRIRGELGTGNFSQVKMGIHALTKEKVAIKILDKTKLDQKTQRLLSREISSMEKLHHPNVIRLYEVVETLAKLHIIMEYAGGGELFTKISNDGKLPEADARILFAQVVAAVQHMHANEIIHRDLKAENVFFSGPRTVKVGDFGFSTYSPMDQALNTFCGSPPYAAPELFKDESYYGGYVDIWAIGILLFFMVTGIMPFRAETVAKLKKCIIEGNYSVPSYVSDSCQFLIRHILKPIPQDRFSIEELKTSDWLENQDFPAPLDRFELYPTTEASDSVTDEELKARETLSELGITNDHFRKAYGKDSRSSITGTYRIVLHKIQKENSNESTDDEQSHHQHPVNENRNALIEKKQSRLCIIL